MPKPLKTSLKQTPLKKSLSAAQKKKQTLKGNLKGK